MSWPALILSAWGDIWEEALSSGCHRTQGIYLPRAPSRPNLINPKILPSLRSMRSDLEPSIYVGAKTTLAKAWYPVKKKWFLPLLLPIQSNICPKVSNMWPFPSSFACFFCFLHLHPEKVKVWPTPFTLCHRDTSAQDSRKDGTRASLYLHKVCTLISIDFSLIPLVSIDRDVVWYACWPVCLNPFQLQHIHILVSNLGKLLSIWIWGYRINRQLNALKIMSDFNYFLLALLVVLSVFV